MTINHDSPASIRAFLDSRGLAPRKRWGQNFLINRGAREKILSFLELAEDLDVWEIGPGLGAMSDSILDAGMRLTVFEIDPAYCLWLKESLGAKGLKLVSGDVSRTWMSAWDRSPPDRILGNLPYNSASAIIAAFIENGRVAPVAAYTVQDEMGQRMKASPGGKDYSSFSILCQTSTRIIDGGRLSPGSFYPGPRVYSRIICLKPDEPWGHIEQPEVFRLLVRSIFNSRRKTLANNLAAACRLPGFPEKECVEEAFSAEKIELSQRPQTVSPGEWVAVANHITAT